MAPFKGSLLHTYVDIYIYIYICICICIWTRPKALTIVGCVDIFKEGSAHSGVGGAGRIGTMLADHPSPVVKHICSKHM